MATLRGLTWWKKHYIFVIHHVLNSDEAAQARLTETFEKDLPMLVNYVRTALAVKLNQFNVDKRAVTAIEYALIAALIAVAIIGAVTTLGKNVTNTFNTVSSEL
jgi:pilus assembly protein Flp/PilA